MNLARQTGSFETVSFNRVRDDETYTKINRISTHTLSALLLLGDTFALLFAGLTPLLILDGPAPSIYSLYVPAIGVGAIIFFLTSHALGLHEKQQTAGGWLAIKDAILSCLLTFAVLMVVGVAGKITESYSRIWFFTWFLTALSFIVVLRAGMSLYIRDRLAGGACLQRALIVNCGGDFFSDDQLARETSNRMRSIGVINASSLETVPDLRPYLRLMSPEVVILSIPLAQVETALCKLKTLSQHAVEVLILPQASACLQNAIRLRRIGAYNLLQVAEPPIAGWSLVAKRAEDLLVAGFGLLLTAPILALTATAIRLESRGPILFRQTRAGFNGNLIEVWKFRSMYVDQTDLNASKQTSKDDPRVTRVGRFIRKTSIDELPQLWNVLQGHMSVVGPRPHALSTSAEGQPLDALVDEYMARHKVKPGITGWAQVNGARGELCSREQVRRRVNYDLQYIKRWSVLFDFKIIVMTVVRMIYDPNAY